MIDQLLRDMADVKSVNDQSVFVKIQYVTRHLLCECQVKSTYVTHVPGLILDYFSY